MYFKPLLSLVFCFLVVVFKRIGWSLQTCARAVVQAHVGPGVEDALFTSMHRLFVSTLILAVVASVLLIASTNDKRYPSVIRIVGVLVSLLTIGVALLTA